MDKKYIADKRNKSKKYKNTKYHHKKEETTEKSNHSAGDNHQTQEQQQQVIEDVIPNNWSRYELKDDDDDEKLLCGEGADYETLLLAPISIDSHFKFKSEQNWDEDIKSRNELSKYFTLNIALLNEGISCVPFIKRHGYDESIISPLELELTKKTSEANLKKYKQTILRKFPPQSEIIITKASDIIKSELPKVITKTPTNEKTNDVIIPEVKEIKTNKEPPPCSINDEDNIDDLLNLKCADLVINDECDNIKVEDPLLEKTEISKVIAPQPAVDLEQWLDDILDD